MSRHRESNLEHLLKMPWWVSAVLGVVIFIAMAWIIPAQLDHDQSLHPFAVALPKLAFLPLGFFALLAIGSCFFRAKLRRLVDQQTGIESIRALPWKEFEYLVVEAFRRQGYQIGFSLGRGADGGVDIVLRKSDRKVLVQCKQWKVFTVGAPVIREMLGLMTAEKADEAIIITSGKFTRDAQDFAAGKPIQLIDGPQLLALVQTVQTNPAIAPSPSPVGTGEDGLRPGEGRKDKTFYGGEGRGEVNNSGLQSPASNVGAGIACPECPSCGQPMVLRTSKRGANAGTQFWGCSTYPACKGTRKA